MTVVEIGPVRMLTVPRELLPEIAVGGYDGSMMFTTQADFIDPTNLMPPVLTMAPAGPYLKARMGSAYTWIIRLGNDELGYILPSYDFVLGFLPYFAEAEGDHYKDTNSTGPHMEAAVFDQGGPLIDFMDWL